MKSFGQFIRKHLKTTFFFLFLPAFYYSVIFFALTYPLLFKFHTHFFADHGDGIQGIWNIWWVNKAITQLHQLPWHTGYIHYPHGTTLLAHTLTPFNGLLAIPLLKFFSLIEVHNLIVIFSFVSSGVAAFLLAFHLTESYGAALIGGAVFTFSSYHFAHAEGHLNLISFEWIPIFVLIWYIFLMKPSIFLAAISSLLLLFNLLCDSRYLIYCLVTACLMALWYILQFRKRLFFLMRKHITGLLVFFLLTSSFLYPVVTSLTRLYLYENIEGPSAEYYSLDLLAPIIPGGHWRFSHLTQFYWSKLPGNIQESSVYMGWVVIIMCIFIFIKRKERPVKSLWLWYLIMFFWWVLSLGPQLQVFGRKLTSCIMPYALANNVAGIFFPALKISETPVRMTVMVMLCASLLCAGGFKVLLEGKWISRIVAFFLLAVLAFEYLPKPIPVLDASCPPYVRILKNVPGKAAVIDYYAGGMMSLYYQTIHEKPIAFGCISRVPESVQLKDRNMDIINSRDFGFLVIHSKKNMDIKKKIFYSDEEATIYDLTKD